MQRTQRSIEKNPYDLEAWSVLLREAQTRHVSDMRPLYERLLTIFPNAARYWKTYIEHEVSRYISNYFGAPISVEKGSVQSDQKKLTNVKVMLALTIAKVN